MDGSIRELLDPRVLAQAYEQTSVSDATPFADRPGALTARQWAIAKQAEFIAWTVTEFAAAQERQRLRALKRASGATVAQVDALIGTEPA